MRIRYKVAVLVVLVPLVVQLACDFSPTTSFDGFDGRGSRVSGQFVEEGSSASGLRASPQTKFEGMTVHVKQNTSIESIVESNGTFELEGIPDGRVTLVFMQDVRVLSEIDIDGVVPNQEIRILVELTVDLRVVLVSTDRDDTDFSVSCAKSPSFWCKASRGNSSTLGQEKFLVLADEAAQLLSGIPELSTREGVADAVCRKGSDLDRFHRELAALALNLAAGLDPGAPLEPGEEFGSIGDAFDAAVAVASGNPSPGEIDEFEELIEDINDNENTTIPGCDDDDSEDDSESSDSESSDSSSSGSSSSG